MTVMTLKFFAVGVSWRGAVPAVLGYIRDRLKTVIEGPDWVQACGVQQLGYG